MTTERIAYINGNFVPESQAVIPFRDLGWMRGIGVYDTERTFDGRVFKLREHLERLWNSLAYIRVEPPMPMDELEAVTLEVARRNLEIVGDDIWVSQRISAGTPVEQGGSGKPTLVVESLPLPFAYRAPFYRDGVNVVTPTVRRTPPWSLSPQVKSIDLLNIWVADHEVHDLDPRAWPMLVDENGCLAEGAGANIFIVRDGKVITPRSRFVLPGITRSTVIELAAELGIPLIEDDIDLFSAATADEIFITSTSLCVCPVASLNGIPTRDRTIPGPITRGLQDAFRELVGVDFVQQYLSRLPESMA